MQVAIRAIAANVIREAIRQKIIYVTVLFTLVLFAVEPMLPSFKVGLRVQLFDDIALGIAYLAIGIIAVALAVNQVPGEVEKRTIYNVLSKPVRRSDFLIGKYLGVVVVLFACSLLMGLSIFGFTFGYFGKVSYGILQGTVTTFLEGALLSAFAILISTFATPTVNVFICIFFYFIGHVKNDALQSLIESSGISRALGLALKYLLPSLENFNASEAVARGVIIQPIFLVELLLYTVLFIAVFLTGASFVLARKEI